MPRSKKKSQRKQKSKIKRASGEKALRAPEQPQIQLYPGMPAEGSVEKVLDFVSPQHVHYKILRTNEMDAYDPVPEPRKKPASTKQRS